MKPQSVTIQMKAIEQYFHVVLLILLLIVAVTLKCRVDNASVYT